MARNIELKARCADLAAARAAALAEGARAAAVLVQTDTYFHARTGRLKLRQIEGRGAELIRYDRPNDTAARASDYVVLPVPADVAAVLARNVDPRAVVRKRRELLFWNNVRIHLDEVDGLGTFVEFEAVLGDGETEADGYAHVARLRDALGLREEDLVAQSYGELIG